MKKAQPYLPLYVQDVLTMQGLAECSAAANGVYLRLLCILHKQEEYGVYRLRETYRRHDDIFVDLARQLGRLMPFDCAEVESCLRELVDCQVLTLDENSISDDGMVQQNALHEKRASAGKKGANVTNGKSFADRFAAANDAAKQAANAENEIEIESENEIDIVEERIEGVKGEEGEPNRFEQTWQVYPRKVEKAAARKAYDARLRDGWSPDELLAAATEYAALCRKEKREQRFIKHASVFFGISTPFADYLPRASPEEEEDDLKDCF